MKTDGTTLEEFSLDPELVKRWVELPISQGVDVQLYRLHLDLLYAAIEGSTLATARLRDHYVFNSNNMLAESMQADMECRLQMTRSINALRQFQSLIMAGVTNSQLDENFRVAPPELADG